MPPRKPKDNVVPVLPDNALAKQAMDAIRQIDSEAHEKKLAQFEQLKSAKITLLDRVDELNNQLGQIDQTVEAITGHPAPSREKGSRRDLKEVRERVERWMEGHRGQKFNAGDLAGEFSELQGASISMFLKPLVASGKVQIDVSDGSRRLKYFVPEG